MYDFIGQERICGADMIKLVQERFTRRGFDGQAKLRPCTKCQCNNRFLKVPILLWKATFSKKWSTRLNGRQSKRKQGERKLVA